MNIKNLNKKYFNKAEYYNSDNIKKYTDDYGHAIDIALIYSGRNRGKSFDVSAKAIRDAWASGGANQFAYIRRFDKEIQSYKVAQYFNDKIDFIKDLTDGEFDGITVYQGAMYFSAHDDNGKLKKGLKCGYVFALNIANQYKSLQYPCVETMIFEEVFTDEQYIADEPQKLLNLISTIQRSRKHVLCYLISNTISRVNPYIDAFGLSNMIRQISGSVDYYRLYKGFYDNDGNELYYLIACEYLADSNIELKKMPKNRKKSTAVLSNTWDEKRQYPTLPQSIAKNYEPVYRAVFINGAFKFYAQIITVPMNLQTYIDAYYNDDILPTLSDDMMQVAFITRKSTEYKYDVRCYTTEPLIFPLATRGLIAICENDKNLLQLIEMGRAFYSNNLIACEFAQCYKVLKNTRGI